MRIAVWFWAIIFFVFSGKDSFSQSVNYKHEGYLIHHSSKNPEHHLLRNKASLSKVENYKTNGFAQKSFAPDSVKEKSVKLNQNCLVAEEHYKVQFRAGRNIRVIETPDSSDMVAEKRDLLSK